MMAGEARRAALGSAPGRKLAECLSDVESRGAFSTSRGLYHRYGKALVRHDSARRLAAHTVV